MRVHELAKELKLTSKDLLAHLKALKISAKNHTSALHPHEVTQVRASVSRKPAAKPATAKPSATAPKAKVPVHAAQKGRPEVAKPARVTRSAPSVTTAPSPKAVSPLGQKAKIATAPTVAAPKPKLAAKAEPPLRVTPGPAAVPARPAASVAAPARLATPAVQSITPTPAVSQGVPGPAPVRPTAIQAPAQQKVKPEAKPAAAPTPAPALPPVAPEPKKLALRFPITVKDLAEQMGVKASDVIKHLMQHKVFASMTHQLDEARATAVAVAFNCDVLPQPTIEEQIFRDGAPDPAKFVPRAPVVTFMGHVDHGKTSLLDAIRVTKVAEKEAGGITQHIGAYEVLLEKGHVTFLDTPGHEAFSALRARGANVTDVVVLVVAADDGVMPQTVEAINHAKAAGVPIIVAINKMDKPDANPQKVKQQLTEHQLISEEWGGKTIMVPVSAKTRQGIDDLLEMLLLESELLELKADPTARPQGTVIEAKVAKDRGPVATLLIEHGTLHVGDYVLVGTHVGRVRAMIDDRGHRVKEAGPTKPVEVLGLPGAPRAGQKFLVMLDEKLARQVAEQRQEQQRQRATVHPKHISLEELHQRIAEGKLKELNLIVKADVQGSLEAIVQSLEKLDVEKAEVQFKILHAGLGDISESDVILAAASEAIVIGFHVGISPEVQVLAANEGVDIRIYQIIYELIHSIKTAIEGLLEPTLEETFAGRAEVRRLFQISKLGMVAGCMVTNGTLRRDCTVRVIRGRERVYEGRIASLRRVKDDVREVAEGVECGIGLEGSADLQVGDLLEAWDVKKVARKLG